MNYVGDFADDATVYIPFNTFDSNDPSASVTITDLAQGDVQVFKAGVIQTTAGAGVTLSLNLGANNGSHLIAIDTSDVTDAGFYAANADYQVRINGTTVDAATINAWVGTFSIENRFMRGTDSAALASVLGAAVGATISADIADLPTVAEFEARTIVSADYVVVGDTIAAVTLVNGLAANVITAASINGDAITAAKIADDAIAAEHLAAGAVVAATFAANAITSTVVADNTITAAKINADAITAAKIADDAIAAEHLATGAVVAATFAANAITSTVVADNTVTAAKLNGDCITNAKIADDAIAAENFATDAISADALSDAAVNQIWAKAFSDLAQGAPSATASVFTAINYIYEAWRNKTETTATRITVFRDDGAEELVRSTISDDATTFTKGEMVTGV